MTMKSEPIKVYTEKEVNLIVNKVIALCKKQKKTNVKKELKEWIANKIPNYHCETKDNGLMDVLRKINESL